MESKELHIYCSEGGNMERATVIFKILRSQKNVDLDIPLDITANDLVLALNSAYGLGIETENIKKCYLKAEDPIVLLRGSKTLKDFGIRNGSTIIFSE